MPFSAFPLSALLVRIIILLVTWVTPALFGSPRSELQDLPRGPAIQRILVKINGGEETTMDLHHSPSASPRSPHLLLCNQQAVCSAPHSLAPTFPTPVSCPGLRVNLWTPERRWEVIYSSLLEKTSCSVFTARPHCSGYENGHGLRKWRVVSSTCRRLDRSQTTWFQETCRPERISLSLSGAKIVVKRS